MKKLIHKVSAAVKNTWRQIPKGVKAAWVFFAVAAVSLQYYAGGNAITEVSAKKVSVGGNVSSANVIKGEKNSTVNGKDLPIYCVQTDDKKVSLSFDAAWGAEDSIKILDILDKHNIKVTFFMTGGWVKEYPDVVKEIQARGHDLGNHSENHKEMSKLTVEQNKQEIQKVHDRVKELTGYEMFLFRPPYGDYDSEMIKTVYEMGYYPIQWSIDSLDWKDYGVDSIIKKVVQNKNLTGGAIILCHNGAKYTAEALDELITGVKEKGYEFVPISEMIIKDNFHMDVTGKQIQN